MKRRRIVSHPSSVFVYGSGDLHGIIEAEHLLVKDQPALHVRREQEVFLRMLMAVATKLQRKFRMREQVADLIRAALDRMNQYAGKFVDDLRRNAAHRACNHGLVLPESFGDGESKAFFKRFLDHDGGSALQ